MLRYDALLYAANIRSIHHKILAAVDARSPTPEVLVLDASAVVGATVSVIDEAPLLERELVARGVTFWLAAIPPRAAKTATLLPRWQELVDAGRIHPTALVAVRAFRQRGR